MRVRDGLHTACDRGWEPSVSVAEKESARDMWKRKGLRFVLRVGVGSCRTEEGWKAVEGIGEHSAPNYERWQLDSPSLHWGSIQGSSQPAKRRELGDCRSVKSQFQSPW